MYVPSFQKTRRNLDGGLRHLGSDGKVKRTVNSCLTPESTVFSSACQIQSANKNSSHVMKCKFSSDVGLTTMN